MSHTKQLRSVGVVLLVTAGVLVVAVVALTVLKTTGVLTFKKGCSAAPDAVLASTNEHTPAREVKSAEELKSVLADNDTCVVEFHANWCGMCRMNEPAVQNVASLAAASGKCFVKAEQSDVGNEVVSKNNIQGFPTFVKFVKGKEVDRIAGGGLDRIRGIVGV